METIIDPFVSVKDISVKTLLKHLTEQPIEHYIKQFVENRFINPDKDKDTEDVIRLYWEFQDIFKNKGYLVNPIQQRLEKYLHNNPQYIKKLYNCRSQFQQQLIKYTESVQAIVKFGRYSMFTTEFDPNVISPMSNGNTSWGEKTGLSAKQLCIVVANENTTFIKSMTSQDDKKYAIGLSRMMKTFSTSNNIKYVNAEDQINANMISFGDFAFIDNISKTNKTISNKINEQREKEADKYDIVFGDPFIKINDINNNNTFVKGMTSNSMINTYTGILSIYSIFETYTFNTEKYKEYIEEYITSNRFKNENQQLYSYTWSRFTPYYEKLLRSFVDRAIIIAHQSMVDYLISIYERSFTIPQLFMYYSPGTMIKTKTNYDVTQCSMVLNPLINVSDGNLSIVLQALCPNTTKIANVMIHDAGGWSDPTKIKAKYEYSTFISPNSNRGGTIFKYFTTNNNFSIMNDEDVERQLLYVKEALKMMNNSTHMDLDGAYYWSEWRYDQKVEDYKLYKGRVIVDYEYSRNVYAELDNNCIKVTQSYMDVYKKCTLDYYKNNVIFPGAPCTTFWSNDIHVLISADDLLKDIRYVLSLPVVTTAYILNDKKWGKVRLSDLKDITYQENAYSDVVMDPKVKEFIRIVTESQDRNTFKDIISDKEGGCIFLLIGNSSIGKTLSVEAIAEVLHKPLYKVTSGELGNSIWDIEDNLKKLLINAKRWNAVVLIDEADVYLQDRKGRSISDNAIVSIFLRQLESYNGIMFLTSNRAIDEIDPAFKNRIIQTFYFPDLNKEDRKKIWINLLKRQDIKFTEKQIDMLSDYNFNGRQIKNIIKASIAKALYCQKEVDYEILHDTLEFMWETDMMNENYTMKK